MASTPTFAATPYIDRAVISAANTNRDGTGTVPQVAAGVANGKRIDAVTFQQVSTTTAAGTLRLFLDDGTTKTLLLEVASAAVTASGTVPAQQITVPTPGLILPSTSWLLRACPNNAETWNVTAYSVSF